MTDEPVRAGRLLLMPNALDHGDHPVPIGQVLAHGVLARAAALGHWVVEDARSARAFLKRVAEVVPLSGSLQSISIVEMPRPRKGSRAEPPPMEWHMLLQPARAGHDIGLLSEAGLPGVADPGARVVEAAHDEGLEVLALAGPSALTLALAASGLNGQSFAFVGYLPQEPQARLHRLRELENLSRQLRQTQVFIETPYRNVALATALTTALLPTTRVSISCGLTQPDAWNRCMTVADWRRRMPAFPERSAAVFALLAA